MKREFPREIFQEIQRIQWQVLRAVEGIFAGEYLSAFKGRGLEFEEVREYQRGDDVRAIDWNVTARMGAPYMKIFREERDLTLFLLVDISASTRYLSHHRSVQSVLGILGGILALSAIQNGDRVGLVLFSDRIEKVVPPAKGRAHGMRIIRDILLEEPIGKGSDVGEALRFTGKMRKRAAVCCLLSDFLFEDTANDLTLLVQRHDVVGFRVFEPFEVAFPAIGLLHCVDEETGEERTIDTSSFSVGMGMQKNMQKWMDTHRQTFSRLGVDLCEVSTAQSLVPTLRRFFAKRKKRRYR